LVALDLREVLRARRKQELEELMARLEARGGGVGAFHDRVVGTRGRAAAGREQGDDGGEDVNGKEGAAVEGEPAAAVQEATVEEEAGEAAEEAGEDDAGGDADADAAYDADAAEVEAYDADA
jgi:hypothetical protein